MKNAIVTALTAPYDARKVALNWDKPRMAADPDVIFCATIFGHCQSKANSRRLVLNRATKKPMFIRNKKALLFEQEFILQTKGRVTLVPIEGDLEITCLIHYPSERNDLDPSLVFDCLQKVGIIRNDRQLKAQHIYRFTSKTNPRVEIELRRL